MKFANWIPEVNVCVGSLCYASGLDARSKTDLVFFPLFRLCPIEFTFNGKNLVASWRTPGSSHIQ